MASRRMKPGGGKRLCHNPHSKPPRLMRKRQAGGHARIGNLCFIRDAEAGIRRPDMTNRGSMSVWPILVVFAALCSVAAQQPAAVAESHQAAGAKAAHEVAAEVLAFEREIEAAVVRGDVGFVDAASAPTFTFTHGDGWTTGGAPLRVDSRADWLATVARSPYASRVLDSVKTEVHGDVVITYGRYVGRFKNAAPGRRVFTVWYQRVYAKRDGRWQYLSHRTVDGPIYEKG
jgi:hypothetical protein